LIVEPEATRRAAIRQRLEREGLIAVEEAGGLEGWNAARRLRLDLLVVSLQLRGIGGIDLLRRVRSISDVPVVLHTAVPDVATAVAAMKLGAQDVLVLPAEIEKLADRARALVAARRDQACLDLHSTVVGKSACAQKVRERLLALSSVRVPVLVSGEAGTGRDRIIHALHDASADRGLRLTIVRAGDALLPPDRHADGIFYLADLHSYSAATQSYWADRLTSAPPAKGPRRVYASTTQDLHAMVRDGTFDGTLAAEIGRFSIEVSPLRERLDDLGELARALASEAGSKLGGRTVRITAPAIAALRSYSWPGNVRELKAVIERLVVFAHDGRITRDHVRSVLDEKATTVASLRRASEERQRRELMELLQETGGNLAEAARRLGMSRGAVIYRAQKFRLLPNRSGRR
jgi:DNA-binding NtrC family response regulator